MADTQNLETPSLLVTGIIPEIIPSEQSLALNLRTIQQATPTSKDLPDLGNFELLPETPFQQGKDDLYKTTGKVKIGLKGKDALLVADGTVSYNDKEIVVKGQVSSTNSKAKGSLFTGTFTIDLAQAKQGKIQAKVQDEGKNDDGEYKFAGLDLDVEELSFSANSDLNLKTQFRLPRNIDKFSLPSSVGGARLGGDNDFVTLTFAPADVSITGGKLNIPKELEKKLEFKLKGIDLKATELSGELQTKPETLVKLQGKVDASLGSLKVGVDLADPNFLQFSNTGLDVKGKLSIKDATIIPKLATITSAELALDSQKGDFDAKATVKIPKDIELSGELKIKNKQLDTIGLQADGLDLPIPKTGVSLNKIGAKLSNLSAASESSVNISGTIGIKNTGKDFTVDLPAFGKKQGFIFKAEGKTEINAERLNYKGNAKFLAGIIEGNSEVDLNWNNGTLKVESDINVLDSTITAKAKFAANKNFDFAAIAGASLKVPNFAPFFKGQTLGSANAGIKFTNDNNYSNDYVAGWGEVKLGLTVFGKFRGVKKRLGIQIPFQGSIKSLGAKEIGNVSEELNRAASSINTQTAVELDRVASSINTQTAVNPILVTVEWDDTFPVKDTTSDVFLKTKFPGVFLKIDDTGAINIDDTGATNQADLERPKEEDIKSLKSSIEQIKELSSSTSKTFLFDVSQDAIKTLLEPVFNESFADRVIVKTGDGQEKTVTPITTSFSELTEEPKIDEIQAQVNSNLSGKSIDSLQLASAEAEDKSLPKSAAQTKDSTVTINYRAFDPDSEAKISLFYDTDGTGTNGILIADNLNETDGPGTYTWDVSDLPSGTYYVYAVIEDGDNAPIYEYVKQPIVIEEKGAPEQVKGLEARWTSGTEIELAWEPVKDPDVAYYVIKYTSDAAGSEETEVATTNGPDNTVVIPDLTFGETYRFTVVAVDQDGNYSRESVAEIATVGSEPTVPLAEGEWEETASPGKTYTAQVLKDKEDDTLTLLEAPPGATLDADGKFTWQVPDNASGWYTIRIDSTDYYGQTEVLSYEIFAGKPDNLKAANQHQGGWGKDTLRGDSNSDTLSAGGGNDIIYGGEGNDLLFGGIGDDSLFGEGGNDTLTGGKGNDSLDGGTGNDLAFGQVGEDVIAGGAGDDRLYGGEDDDELSGGTGNDSLFGEGDFDVLNGGEGNDFLSGGEGSDSLVGGAGDDSLTGGEGDDFATGGTGNDLVAGDSGSDSLIGGMGSDRLLGGEGSDSLIGVSTIAENPGRGEVDTLTGGAGDDIFVLGEENQPFYEDGNSADGGLSDYALIVDFNGNEDLIVLSGFESDYVLQASPAGLPAGTAIFRSFNSTPELIAIVQGDESLSLASAAFSFV